MNLLLLALRSLLLNLWMAATVVPWAIMMMVLSIGVRGERPPDGGAAQSGVAGEVEFLVRGKNAHAIVRRGIGGLEQERSFRKIGPVRDGLHLLRREPIGMGHDRERVTGKRRGGKDIDFKELEVHARQCSQPWG